MQDLKSMKKICWMNKCLKPRWVQALDGIERLEWTPINIHNELIVRDIGWFVQLRLTTRNEKGEHLDFYYFEIPKGKINELIEALSSISKEK